LFGELSAALGPPVVLARYPAPDGARAASAHGGGVDLDAAGQVMVSLYALPPAPWVTPLSTLPEVVPEGAFAAVSDHFWLQGDPAAVLTDRPLAPTTGPAGPDVAVRDLVVSRDGARLQFYVDSPSPVAVLVRVAYHSGWHATVSGEPTAVRRATPGLVLIEGRGAVTLEFRRSPATVVGASVSFCAWILFGFWGVGRVLRRVGARRVRCGDGEGHDGVV